MLHDSKGSHSLLPVEAQQINNIVKENWNGC